jgi:hypothetical protein
VTESVATGRDTWLGHVIACPECGAQNRWTLTTEQPTDATGETAWAQCANGQAYRGEPFSVRAWRGS